MAWLSVGNSNDDMIDKLIEHNVFHGNNQAKAIQAFRLTDRGDFIHRDFR